MSFEIVVNGKYGKFETAGELAAFYERTKAVVVKKKKKRAKTNNQKSK